MKACTFLLLAMLPLLLLHAQAPADSAFYASKQSLWLSKKTGTWNVTMTLQPSAQATPLKVTQIEAQRTMVGAFCLHETMHPAKGAPMPPFQRISDLDYNFNDARWDYMSIDTRITAGIMFFSNVPDTGDSIVSYIMNSVHPGFGPKQLDRGKSMRVKNVIITLSSTHDVVKQYWKLTDGQEWLAVVYDYIKKE